MKSLRIASVLQWKEMKPYILHFGKITVDTRQIMEAIMKYDLYSEFDAKLHRQFYPHYFEAIMYPDGRIENAIPSHQEKLIKICCDKLGVDRIELMEMCPSEYCFDVITWMCNLTGCVSVWTNFYMKSDNTPLTEKQKEAFKMLIEEGVYEGKL